MNPQELPVSVCAQGPPPTISSISAGSRGEDILVAAMWVHVQCNKDHACSYLNMIDTLLQVLSFKTVPGCISHVAEIYCRLQL